VLAIPPIALDCVVSFRIGITYFYKAAFVVCLVEACSIDVASVVDDFVGCYWWWSNA
jgi:hypothetical protein